MKYIKKYENKNIGHYFKIMIDGSWYKFVIALEKLNIKEKFFNDWEIENFDDILPENKKYFNNKYIFLIIIPNQSDVPEFLITNTIEQMLWKFDLDIKNFDYKGIIYVEDWELSAKQYNL